jgi:hypothetical protein
MCIYKAYPAKYVSNITIASYKICHVLAKRRKPSSDGEVVKEVVNVHNYDSYTLIPLSETNRSHSSLLCLQSAVVAFFPALLFGYRKGVKYCDCSDAPY